jgi:hypothetical protein
MAVAATPMPERDPSSDGEPHEHVAVEAVGAEGEGEARTDRPVGPDGTLELGGRGVVGGEPRRDDGEDDEREDHAETEPKRAALLQGLEPRAQGSSPFFVDAGARRTDTRGGREDLGPASSSRRSVRRKSRT